MEKIDWKVEGMTCSNCAQTVSKFLVKEGMEEVPPTRPRSARRGRTQSLKSEARRRQDHVAAR